MKVDKIVYPLVCLGTFGIAYFLRVIITKAIVEANRK